MNRLRGLTRQLQGATSLTYSSRPILSQRIARMSSISEKMQALQIQKQGGLEVLEIRDTSVPIPKESEVLIKVEYAGVNYIDTYQRSGLYKLEMPFVLGNEAAGTVIKSGSKVTDVKEGSRVVAYCSGGGFAQYASVPRSRIYTIPNDVDTKLGAASVLQGLTGKLTAKPLMRSHLSNTASLAWTLVKEAYALKKGDWCLVHAAAGGVGLLLCQMASHLGARVIGTTSNAEKAQLAKNNGAEHVINYTKESIVDRIMELTEGRGVQGIYDGVGKDTWEGTSHLMHRVDLFN